MKMQLKGKFIHFQLTAVMRITNIHLSNFDCAYMYMYICMGICICIHIHPRNCICLHHGTREQVRDQMVDAAVPARLLSLLELGQDTYHNVCHQVLVYNACQPTSSVRNKFHCRFNIDYTYQQHLVLPSADLHLLLELEPSCQTLNPLITVL